MKDTIYRRDATSIPVIPKEHRKYFHSLDDAYETGWNDALACVNMLPSAQRKGKWVLTVDGYRCSKCNYKLQTTGIPMFCPNCGASMV